MLQANETDIGNVRFTRLFLHTSAQALCAEASSLDLSIFIRSMHLPPSSILCSYQHFVERDNERLNFEIEIVYNLSLCLLEALILVRGPQGIHVAALPLWVETSP